MMVLGLTGSIGMGKSTTLAMFAEAGVPTYSADAAVHALYANEAVPLIESAFPGTVANGKVDREKLSRAVLGNREQLARIEAMIDDAVRLTGLEFIKAAGNAGARLAVVDIPLLFETGGEKRVDKIAVVSAEPDVQRQRVLARPGMSEAKLDAILARQMPDADKRAKAHYIINTGNGLEPARAAVRAIIKSVTESGADA